MGSFKWKPSRSTLYNLRLKANKAFGLIFYQRVWTDSCQQGGKEMTTNWSWKCGSNYLIFFLYKYSRFALKNKVEVFFFYWAAERKVVFLTGPDYHTLDQAGISRRKRKVTKPLLLPEELSILCLEKASGGWSREKKRWQAGSSQQSTACKTSLEGQRLPYSRADPSQGNVEKTDGFVIQHKRPCSLIQN